MKTDISDDANHASFLEKKLRGLAEQLKSAPAHRYQSDPHVTSLIAILEDSDYSGPCWQEIEDEAWQAHNSDYDPISQGIDQEPSEMQTIALEVIDFVNGWTYDKEKPE